VRVLFLEGLIGLVHGLSTALLLLATVSGCTSSSRTVFDPQSREKPDGLTWSIDAERGVVLSNADGTTRFCLGGVAALDHVQYDSRNARDPGLRLDRAVIRLDGSIEGFELRVGADLRGIDTRYGLDEAWVSYEVVEPLRVTAGFLEIPLGFDFSFAEEDLPGVGYSVSSFIDGRTDLALRIDGQVGEGLLYYDLTAAAGEGFDLSGQKRESPQFSARLVTYPLRFTEDLPLLSGLFAGFGISYSPDFHGDFDLATPLRNKVFRVSDLRARRARFYHLTLGADAGPLRIVLEAVPGEVFEEWFGSGSGFFGVDTPQGKVDIDQVGSWELGLSWMITGERYDSRPFQARKTGGKATPFPARPLFGGDRDHGTGALEACFRYSNADIDRKFFQRGLTNDRVSSQEFRILTGALNWYPSPNLRVTVQVVRTIADGYPAVFDSHGRDTSFVFRLQYDL